MFGGHVLLRYAYEAARPESGRRLEPMFASIVTPLQRQAADTSPHTARSLLRDQTVRWEDEARELHEQNAQLASDSGPSAQRRAADFQIDP